MKALFNKLISKIKSFFRSLFFSESEKEARCESQTTSEQTEGTNYDQAAAVEKENDLSINRKSSWKEESVIQVSKQAFMKAVNQSNDSNKIVGLKSYKEQHDRNGIHTLSLFFNKETDRAQFIAQHQSRFLEPLKAIPGSFYVGFGSKLEITALSASSKRNAFPSSLSGGDLQARKVLGEIYQEAQQTLEPKRVVCC